MADQKKNNKKAQPSKKGALKNTTNTQKEFEEQLLKVQELIDESKKENEIIEKKQQKKNQASKNQKKTQKKEEPVKKLEKKTVVENKQEPIKKENFKVTIEGLDEEFNTGDKKAKKKDKKKIIKIALIVLAVLLVIFAIQAILVKSRAENLKVETKNLVQCLKDGDIDAANESYKEVDKLSKRLRFTLYQPQWLLLSKMPLLGDDIYSARVLVSMMCKASNTVIKPCIDAVEGYPLSEIKVDEGFNAKAIAKYLDIAKNAAPLLEKYDIDSLNFRFVKSANKYVELLKEVSEIYKENKDYLTLIEKIIGDGEDKFYLIVAQNSAEIRASGGFPGSIGTVVIKDGYIKVGDFEGTNSVLIRDNTVEGQSTNEEFTLFSFWVQYPRDLCYNPNFERIAYQWSKSYLGDETVDGVISMTPVIIEKLLEITGPITLSNGVELNGDNATKYIQRDIYFEYFSVGKNSWSGNDQSDALFAETAKLTLGQVFDNLSLDKMVKYIELFKTGVDERIIELWSADEETEDLIKDLGCSGGIAFEDATGIFFSCNIPSKLGWFFDLSTQVSKATVNKDGTKTYDVTAYVSNTITKEEISQAGSYIIGDGNGYIDGFLHIFAPDGGIISDVKAKGIYFSEGEYEGHQCFYSHGVSIAPGYSLKVTYKVTTKKGVDDLRVIHTPTLKESK